MVDREKVIKGLECIAQKREPTANPCKDCGYSDRLNYAICVKDIASDALALLKEQETTRPVFNGRFWECEECRQRYKDILTVKEYAFCPWCGRRIEWERDV